MKRCSGVLLHPTSLPSPWGVGDLGPSADKFIDLIASAGQSVWQILPLTPVSTHGSPYSAHSLLAGNPLLLSPERLADDGFIEGVPSKAYAFGEGSRVDYPRMIEFKERLVENAFSHSFNRIRTEEDYLRFRQENSDWLDDFALYHAIRKEQGTPWFEWPEDLRKREEKALNGKREKLAASIDLVIFSQYLFDKQWASVAKRAKTGGVEILGDVPFYVLHDSADIWSHPELFKVDNDGKAVFVGGVPPDYFSETGQRWGNPVYNWDQMEATGYQWWKERVTRSQTIADTLRLDHFRGYVSYWEIPQTEETAVNGEWVEVPKSFLRFVASAFPDLPFVAEDLGIITREVNEARDRLGIPGMRVLQFGFDGSQDNQHHPRNHAKNSFVYTSTHDTNTVLGWYLEEAKSGDKEELSKLLGHTVGAANICSDLVGTAMSSIAEVSVIPVQDLLCLGSDSRMNNPATAKGNWAWRMTPDELSEATFRRLGELTVANGRV